MWVELQFPQSGQVRALVQVTQVRTGVHQPQRPDGGANQLIAHRVKILDARPVTCSTKSPVKNTCRSALRPFWQRVEARHRHIRAGFVCSADELWARRRVPGSWCGEFPTERAPGMLVENGAAGCREASIDLQAMSSERAGFRGRLVFEPVDEDEARHIILLVCSRMSSEKSRVATMTQNGPARIWLTLSTLP